MELLCINLFSAKAMSSKSGCKGKERDSRLEKRYQFFQEYGCNYGYKYDINTWIKTEFDRAKGVYLDHVGSALYSNSQIKKHMVDLESSVYGNPHSGNYCSQRSAYHVEEARNIVARHFNTTLEKHHIIFTSGATGALKLIGESFFWRPQSSFVYLEDNHTSVVGIREIVKHNGGNCVCVTESVVKDFSSIKDKCTETSSHCCKQDLIINHPEKTGPGLCTKMNTPEANVEPGSPSDYICNFHPKDKQNVSNSITDEVFHLFCYPAMSNFCGRKYSFDWIDDARQGSLSPLSRHVGSWYILLDAASFVGTNILDLSKVSADFIVISFYKMFGFPTGIGALIVKAGSACALTNKMYYGGGTVYSTISSIDHHVFREGVAERLEDGTVSFLSIMALKHGFDTLKGLTGSMELIAKHTFSLAKYTFDEMESLKYENGQKLCEIYCDTNYGDIDFQGPVINFNLLCPDGTMIGYSQVEKLANTWNIHLRTGCFCNTGDCQKHLGLTVEEILDNLKKGHVCGDEMDLINGKPTGSVRISFGYMSTFTDAQTFLDFLNECFLSKRIVGQEQFIGNSIMCAEEQTQHNSVTVEEKEKYNVECNDWYFSSVLKQICVYPIKSCSSFVVAKWWISKKGLLYDREWMVVTEYGSIMTQKREPRLVLIKPLIDLENDLLTLQCDGYQNISVSLKRNFNAALKCIGDGEIQSTICGDRVSCNDCGEEPALWLSCVLGQSCRLVRQNLHQPRIMKTSMKNPENFKGVTQTKHPQLTLANESQYLLISESSLSTICNDSLVKDSYLKDENLWASFRANFVVQGNSPFEEDMWKHVRIGSFDFKVSGGCMRCQTICVNQKTGEKNRGPLEQIMKLRGPKMEFGIYLVSDMKVKEGSSISVGDGVLYK